MKYVIGLNSGTSYDGVDVALVKFKGRNLKPFFVSGNVYPYPRKVKEMLREYISGNKKNRGVHDLLILNFLVGEIFADAALNIIKKNKLHTKDILLIGSHGQTIFHHPWFHKISGHNVRGTLQIGESSIIAGRTGINTISNFRERDIAAGGEGAPLMPYLDWIMFNESKDIKAILNIGGISNITIVGKNTELIAFDIGPGNALIDLISKKYFDKDIDKKGKIASRGNIYFNLVDRALKDSYFKQKPPKSTGKEYFNQEFIDDYFKKIKRKEDKLATITYLSAKVIEKALYDFVLQKHKVNEIIISGGGIKNKTLMKHLRKLLPHIKIVSSDKYKLPYKFKEAILFALLGYTCLLRNPNNIPSCTGAKKKVILGKMCY